MDNFEPHSLYLFDKKAIKESYRIQITHSVVSTVSAFHAISTAS